MLPDLHMHTCYSHDGAPHSTVDALCQRAIELGLPAIAITDHFDINRELAATNVRTLPRDLIYRDVLAAREKYGDRLLVLHGVELGQAIAHPERSVELIGELPYDIVLGSVHNLENEQDFAFFDFAKISDDEAHAYFDRVIAEEMQLCDFDGIHVITHLTYMDRYMHRAGKALDITPHKDTLSRLLEKIVQKGLTLELNTSCLGDDLGMPTPEILSLYRSLGGTRVCLGSDGHFPERITQHFDKGAKILLDCGFTELTLPTRTQTLTYPIPRRTTNV